MKTPLGVSVMMVGANVVLNIFFVLTLPMGWKHAGIAGSTVVCSLGACILLAWKARRANGPLGLGRLVKPVANMGFASLLMGAAVLVTRHVVVGALGDGRMAGLVAVVAAITVAALVYGLAVWRLCPAASRRVLMLKRRHES
jgi:peptidoglycan biosynthesis protein MviN/MurJ (putative lipid II flippase)